MFVRFHLAVLHLFIDFLVHRKYTRERTIIAFRRERKSAKRFRNECSSSIFYRIESRTRTGT